MATHLKELPTSLRLALHQERRRRGWSQTELGKRVGMPQVHISSIETGKIVPRFDTLAEIARALDFELLLIPRRLVPAVESLLHQTTDTDERQLYELGEPEEAV